MLKKDIVRGILVTNIGSLINRVIQFVTRIILAQLLLPEEFGIVALALVFTNFFGLFNSLGIESALIQKKDQIQKLINPAFIIVNFLGITLFILLFLSSKSIAKIYNTPQLDLIIKILAIVLIIYPFKIIPWVKANIDFKFNRIIIAEIISNLVFLFTTIILATFGFKYWSLIIGYLFSNFMETLIFWIILPYRFRFNLTFSGARELIDYGKHISIAGIISFFITQGDHMLVGKILGLNALGFYALALTISDLTMVTIAHSLARVAFPTYADFQKNMVNLNKTYIKNVEILSFLVLPLLLFILIFGKQMVFFILGQKWMPMVLGMQILCFHGLFRAMHINSSMLLNAVGKPKTNQNILIVELLLLGVIIYPFTIIGNIAGTALAITLARFFGFYFSTKVAMIQIRSNYLGLLKYLYPQIGSIIIIGFMIILLNFLIPADSLIILFSYALSLFLGYFILNLLLNQYFIYDLKLVISAINPLKN